MGKPKHPRRLPDNEAMAKARNLRTSAQKLNEVAESIRGKSAESALSQLAFSKRRIANDVRKVLQSAIANAENNHQLDVDRLFVSAATVSKSFVLKRFRPRAKGRAGRIIKPWSSLTVIVREREETV
ncbi:MAG: 50S ribosomal protein L22 [Alphaproteobacteria bacterium]